MLLGNTSLWCTLCSDPVSLSTVICREERNGRKDAINKTLQMTPSQRSCDRRKG